MLCRRLLALRKERHDLRRGAYSRLDAPDGAWLFRRGEGTLVALNLSSAEVAVDVAPGDVLIGTHRAADAVAGPVLGLAPWEGVVLSRR